MTTEATVANRVFFIRHAETEKNAKASSKEDRFSSNGRQQISALTKELQKLGLTFDKVYVSPLWRAQQTIKPFLESQNESQNGTYQPVAAYTVDGIAECCWDAESDEASAVKAAADKIKAEVAAAGRPQTILIVGHYISGQILLERLVGKKTKPRNAKIMEFALKTPAVKPAEAGTTGDQNKKPVAKTPPPSPPAAVPPTSLPAATAPDAETPVGTTATPGATVADKPATGTGALSVQQGALTAKLVNEQKWTGGRCYDLLVENSASTPTKNWSVHLTVRKGVLDQDWNLTTLKSNLSDVTVAPAASWNREIAAKSSNQSQGLCVKDDGGTAEVGLLSIAP